MLEQHQQANFVFVLGRFCLPQGVLSSYVQALHMVPFEIHVPYPLLSPAYFDD